VACDRLHSAIYGLMMAFQMAPAFGILIHSAFCWTMMAFQMAPAFGILIHHLPTRTFFFSVVFFEMLQLPSAKCL
jgi:hypothetical protein